MRIIDAQAKLLSLNQKIIQTMDAAACLNISRMHASKILGRLASANLVISIGRGLWALSKQIDPLVLPEYLTSPLPSYISLQTALYYHGMISQIPSVIYAVSLARTRQYHTPFGTISIHHISSDFFMEYTVLDSQTNIKIATPEKALLDLFYLTPARSKLFAALPELEIPKNFDKKKAYRLINKIPFAKRRTLVKNKLDYILRDF